jgi:hypothetical protein
MRNAFAGSEACVGVTCFEVEQRLLPFIRRRRHRRFRERRARRVPHFRLQPLVVSLQLSNLELDCSRCSRMDGGGYRTRSDEVGRGGRVYREGGRAETVGMRLAAGNQRVFRLQRGEIAASGRDERMDRARRRSIQPPVQTTIDPGARGAVGRDVVWMLAARLRGKRTRTLSHAPTHFLTTSRQNAAQHFAARSLRPSGQAPSDCPISPCSQARSPWVRYSDSAQEVVLPLRI